MILDPAVISAFVLCLARTTAWVMTTPVLGGRSIPGMARLAVATSLAIFVAPTVSTDNLPADPVNFIGIALGQVLIGLAIGWLTGLFFSAFEMAGSMVDTASGFSMATIFDPISGTQVSIYARFNQMLFLVLLFVTNGHLTLIAGFIRSFDAIPSDTFPVFGQASPELLGHAVSQLMVAALEIGAPILGALFLTEVALALAARFAPQANIFAVGLPLKVMVSILAMGTVLVLLPRHIPGLMDNSLNLTRSFF